MATSQEPSEKSKGKRPVTPPYWAKAPTGLNPNAPGVHLRVDPLRCHPAMYVQDPVAPSASTTASKPAKADESDSADELATPRAPRIQLTKAPTPEEINKKVAEMLEATEALKPSQSNTLKPDNPKQSTSSKMFAKISNVFSPRKSRANGAKSGHRKSKSVQLTSETADEISFEQHQRQQRHARPSTPMGQHRTVSGIELRLNEGLNLNKEKIQQMFKSKITRKNVADNGRSLRSAVSSSGLSDQTITPARYRETEENERARHVRQTLRQLEGREPSSDDGSRPDTPVDPFLHEEEFFADLDTGFLQTSPVGSSTPRPRHDRDALPSDDVESPTKRKRYGIMLRHRHE